MSSVDLLEGYRDGLDLTCPEPTGNRSPFYIHGFRNGRDDRLGKPRKLAEDIRNDLKYIEAMMHD